LADGKYVLSYFDTRVSYLLKYIMDFYTQLTLACLSIRLGTGKTADDGELVTEALLEKMSELLPTRITEADGSIDGKSSVDILLKELMSTASTFSLSNVFDTFSDDGILGFKMFVKDEFKELLEGILWRSECELVDNGVPSRCVFGKRSIQQLIMQSF